MANLTPTEHLERITRQRAHVAEIRDQLRDANDNVKDLKKRLDIAEKELDRVIENPDEEDPELPYEQGDGGEVQP